MPKKYATKKELTDFYSKPSQVNQYNKKWGGLDFSVRSKRQASIVNEFIRHVSPRVVLDVGVGNARLAKQLKGVKRGIGVDTSKAMLDVARKELGGNWGVVVGDAFRLPVKKKSIDLLISTRLLRILAVKDRCKVLRSFRETLKDDGFLVIDALNQRALFKSESDAGKKINSYYWTKKELIKELKDNGFGVVKVRPVFNYFFVKRFLLRYKGQKLRKLVSVLINFSERLGDVNALEWLVLCQKAKD
ncbi:class I SAM-dependent methyltransferase [archaeon]|nr:class I SAM-dependent methyltransferase [archaeon]